MAGKMAHVVARLGRLGDDLTGIDLSCLAQRPQRGRARPGPAVAEDRPRAPLEHSFGLGDHLRGNPFSAQWNGVIDQARRDCGSLDLRAGGLIGRFPVWAIVDDGDEICGFERCDVFGPDLSRNADVIVDPLQVQVTTPIRAKGLPGSLYPCAGTRRNRGITIAVIKASRDLPPEGLLRPPWLPVFRPAGGAGRVGSPGSACSRPVAAGGTVLRSRPPRPPPRPAASGRYRRSPRR